MKNQHAVLLWAGIFWILGAPSLAGALPPDLLEKAGRTVVQFWEQIPNFACKESVLREKIEKNGKIEYKEELEFDYLALTKMRDEGLTVEEQRLLLKKNTKKSEPPSLLDTNGFPTLQLIFHPRYRANYRFEAEEDGAENKGPIRVRFEHIQGAASTSAVMVQGKAYALDLRGTAWIDRETGVIQRIAASLMNPMKEINVASFDAEVVYERQPFPLENESRWLPSKVTVELQTGLQHWRNIHLFSQYKRFEVEAVEAKAQ